MNSVSGNARLSATALLRKASQLLSDAPDNRDAACRYPVLATVDETGGANARTLILRAFDPERWRVTLHTDRRSEKMREIAGCNAASLLFYDHGAAFQVRMKGTVAIEHDETVIAGVWRNLPEGNKPNYRSAEPPGTSLEGPGDSGPDIRGIDGFENFAILVFEPDSVDILALSPQANRRYRFEPALGRGCWLVP
ncbi:pyridoxamine 5'-phosphate oxidase family protein [Nisaea sp.]|uniref:pyridoxamine 5'-phosphate oxidase family protein n=1 Tax=Nisaea sp. TaxID=2024842 RepID=UPI003B5201C2